MVSILKLIRTAKQKAKCPFITQKVTNQSEVFAIATKNNENTGLSWWWSIFCILFTHCYHIYSISTFVTH